MLLVDGEVSRMPEDLARRRVDDGGVRADLAQDLEEAELASGVDLQVEARARHRFDVAHLTRQVEDDRVPVRGVVDVTEEIEVAGADAPRASVRVVGRRRERESATDLPAVGAFAVMIEEPLSQV